jgi:chromosome segregation ATPase
MSARDTARGAKQKPAHPGGETAYERLHVRGEQLLSSLAGLRKLLPENEQGLDGIMQQIESLRGTLSKRAQETGRGIEARAERVLNDLERQAVRRLGPLLTRANVLSRTDVAPMESRIAHLEGRLGTLLDDRATLTSRVLELERNLEDARATASEREREASLALNAGDQLHGALSDVREHLDALSKEQMSRNLDAGRFQDRLTRLEMRLGDLLKEHGSRLGDQEDVRQRLAAINDNLEASTRTLRNAAEEAAAAVAATRETATRLDSLREERTADRGELFQLAHRIGDVERALRQVELRLGDLAERHTAGREELAALAARVSQLELVTARPSTAAGIHGQAEGH